MFKISTEEYYKKASPMDTISVTLSNGRYTVSINNPALTDLYEQAYEQNWGIKVVKNKLLGLCIEFDLDGPS